MFRHFAFPFLFAAVALAACGGDDPNGPGEGPGEPTPVPVATVELPSAPGVLELGESVRLVAIPKSATGQPLPNRVVSWESSEPGVASIDEDGVLTGTGEGTAIVTATSEGKKARHSVRVVVDEPVVAQVIIMEGETATLHIGETLALNAQARDAQGQVIGGKPVTWTSTNLDAADVSATGLVTAGFTGSARIIAIVEGFADTLELTVIPSVQRVELDPEVMTLARGETDRISALAYGEGSVVLDRPVTWRSSDPAVASVAANGTVTAHREGRVTITASAEGVEGEAIVNVTQARDYEAVLANGVGLPAQLFTRPEQGGGTIRYVAQSGTMRIMGDRYEQTFDMLVFHPNRPMVQGTFVTIGSALRDVMTGDWIFTPDGGTLPTFRGTVTGGNSLLVAQRFFADATEATVVYAPR